jgi:phosphoribosylformylglycinamidine synthase
MLVGNENGIERRDILADSSEALGDFAAAETGIDQNAGAACRDKNRVAGTAAGQNAKFEDGGAPFCLIGMLRTTLQHLLGEMFIEPEAYNGRFRMKARIYVTMKPTVLDPQGQTICSALQGMGHREITSVRQGKYFELGLADGLARDAALKMLEEVAADVLANPVIEEYRLEILD